jgi:predicted nucleotidyltransferase
MSTAQDLTAAQRRTYTAAIALRLERAPERADADAALAAARQVAQMLKDEFGATHVWLFGSLASGAFTRYSDIDLATDGIAPERFFTCVARAEDVGGDYEVDVVDLGACRPAFRERVVTTGIQL